MKGQSLIMQFVLFFVIGLALFLSIGNIFRLQSDMFREDVANASVELVNSYLSAVIISMHGCNQCDTAEARVKIENTTAGYFIEASLDSSGLHVQTVPVSKSFTSSVHNLNASLAMDGSAPSIKPITLTYNKNKNNLVIG